MNTETTIFDTLKVPEKLVRFLPLRIVVRSVDGVLQGICEESFSMSTSVCAVRIWWSGKAYSMLGEHQINGIGDAEHNAKPGDLIIDPLSDDCPIEIDWDKWLTASTKYSQRNASFKLKGGVQ